MPITNETGALYTVGGVGVVAAFFKLWKVAMQTMRAEKMENAAVMSDLTSYKRLQDEIIRLESIIKVQQNRLEKMEHRFADLRSMQLDDVADIATLRVLLQGFPCGKCANPTGVFSQTRDILIGMHERHKATRFVAPPDTYNGPDRREPVIDP